MYGASQLNIFPIAVLDVTTSDSNKEELLLCFNGKLSGCTLKAWIHASTFRVTLTVKASFHIKKFQIVPISYHTDYFPENGPRNYHSLPISFPRNDTMLKNSLFQF